MDFSIINYYGKNESKCGYCKGTKCSIAHGMHAYNMCPKDYQDLIDRGWRRSGQYCYKPFNKVTCCPCYTIKCDALEFKLSKSHKKVLKRMSRFLRDGKKEKCDDDGRQRTESESAEDAGGGGGGGIGDEPKAPNVSIRNVNLEAVAAANPIRHAAAGENNEHFDDQPQSSSSALRIQQKSEAMQIDENAVNASLDSMADSLSTSKKSYDGLNPPCKKAKQRRLERRQAKLEAKGIAEPITTTASADKTNASREKTLSDYIADSSPDDKHKLKLKLMHVRSKQFSATLNKTYALYQKYQCSIHNDPPEHVTDYLEFLQRSPLKHTKTNDGPLPGYGSFHQQYWLDDTLIAVAVIDILPYCVSSVYFFYDPDYSFLSLGTYGSLREIELVQKLAESVPALKYYYMGFYIHSCPKMRYKGKLVPSYLLCPETYTWNLLTDEVRSKLDAHKYQRLNTDTTARDIDEFLESHLDLVLLLVENNVSTYRQYIQITGDDDDRELILEYGRLVGKTCAHRMLYLKI